MSSRPADPALDLALECVDAVRRTYGARGDVPGKFRTRCRQLIESIYYSGLSYTLAYAASKVGDAALDRRGEGAEVRRVAEETSRKRVRG